MYKITSSALFIIAMVTLPIVPQAHSSPNYVACGTSGNTIMQLRFLESANGLRVLNGLGGGHFQSINGAFLYIYKVGGVPTTNLLAVKKSGGQFEVLTKGIANRLASKLGGYKKREISWRKC